jgi:hypothetical protein
MNLKKICQCDRFDSSKFLKLVYHAFIMCVCVVGFNKNLPTVNQRFLLHFFIQVLVRWPQTFEPLLRRSYYNHTYIISQWESICCRRVFCTLFSFIRSRKKIQPQIFIMTTYELALNENFTFCILDAR